MTRLSHHLHGPACGASRPSPAERLAEAERRCARRGGRLTDQRRMVLERLLEADRAVGAYELIEMVSERAGKRVAPTAIYRALDFLTGNDLVHRIESRNAFLACPGDHGPHPQAIFMICETCGRVGEALSAGLEREFSRLTAAAGFSPRTRVIELTGVCAECRAAA